MIVRLSISTFNCQFVYYITAMDIFIILVFLAGAIIGFRKGFVKQLASILGLVVGLLVAKALYASLATKLCPTVTHSMTVAQVLAFIIIWILVPVLFTIAASLLTKLMETVSLGWLNKWLGAGIGALKYLILISLLLCIIDFVDSHNKLISQTKKTESVLYYPTKSFAGIFFPAANRITKQYIIKEHASRRTK